MATAYTSLLGLALPATGELSGTWGDTVNNYITSYLDSSIAGGLAVSLTADTALTKTTNSSLGSSSSQYAILNVTPNASTWSLTVPAASKMYVVNNLSGTYTFVFKALGQTGVTISTSEKCIVAFNGTDFVKIGSTVPISTVTVPQGGTGITSGTSGGVPYFSGSTTIASSAALAASAIVLGGGAGTAPATTTTGTGVVTAIGNAVNNTSGLVTQTATLTSSALLLGGGASTGIASTTTGSGVVTALGVTTNAASGIVVKDANANITTNSTFNGFTSVAASVSLITLTASSTPVYSITGSGGQTIQLPNATTLPNGAIFSFNNNQSSGAITVNNNSSTLVASIPSGAYVTVVLLSNATAAGSWDRHDQSPSNVSWSTNTFSYPGAISSATWNGATVGIAYGGTNSTATPTAGGISYGTSTAYAFTSAGTSGQPLISAGASAPSFGNLSTAAGGTGLSGATPFTSSGIVYASSASALASGSGLTFDGTNFLTTGSATATRFVPSGSTVATNGMYLSTTNTLNFSTNSTNRLTLTSAGYTQPVAYADTVVAAGNTGTALTLTCTSGNVFTATLTGNATITLSAPIATGSSSLTLILTNDATASRTIAWAGGTFKFPGGAASLSRTTTANATDIWVFFTPDGGTTWYGNISMKNMTT